MRLQLGVEFKPDQGILKVLPRRETLGRQLFDFTAAFLWLKAMTNFNPMPITPLNLRDEDAFTQQHLGPLNWPRAG
jgi:hypothetical protein